MSLIISSIHWLSLGFRRPENDKFLFYILASLCRDTWVHQLLKLPWELVSPVKWLWKETFYLNLKLPPRTFNLPLNSISHRHSLGSLDTLHDSTICYLEQLTERNLLPFCLIDTLSFSTKKVLGFFAGGYDTHTWSKFLAYILGEVSARLVLKLPIL